MSRADPLRTRLPALARELGFAYVVLAGARRVLGAAASWVEDRLLAIEGARGVLGPAHRRWDRHTVAANRAVWSQWDWRAGGEEWTESPEWKDALVRDVLRPSMPEGGTILEIGPGAGRWSAVLLERAERLILVDITERTLELCRERLGDDPRVSYLRTDGSSLSGVPEESVDAVWSFDAFVHIAPVDVDAYLGEIARVLRAGGGALIHHTGRRDPRGWRSPMTATLFAALARDHGLVVERQFDSWAGGRFDVRPHGDVITALRKPRQARCGT